MARLLRSAPAQMLARLLMPPARTPVADDAIRHCPERYVLASVREITAYLESQRWSPERIAAWRERQ